MPLRKACCPGVIDPASKPARLLYHVNVETVPEGIEFTPDGSQLFVQLTSANHSAVFGWLRLAAWFPPNHGEKSACFGWRAMNVNQLPWNHEQSANT